MSSRRSNRERNKRMARGFNPIEGFSLIELMIAMVVLAVGLLGGIMVIGVAKANNGRSKLHTTAVTLAESTMEQIVASPRGAAAGTTMTDCAGNVFTIQTAPGGSPLIGSGAFAGSVDFSQPQVPNYSMRYVMCGPGNGAVYDIRWNVDNGPTPSTQLATVSAKILSGNASPAAIFTIPYTLRQYRGDF